MRKTLTDKGVAALKPRPTRYHFPDPQLTGHLRPGAANRQHDLRHGRPRSERQTNLAHGRQRRGAEDRRSPRGSAEAIKRIKAGLPPLESPPVPPDSFKSVAENWLSVTSTKTNCGRSRKSNASYGLCLSALGRPSVHRNPPQRFHRPARSHRG